MIKLSEAIIIRLKKLTKEKGIKTNWQLYKSSGVPKSTINALMRRDSEYPNLGTLQNICDGMGISIAEFFNDPIFNDTYHESE